MQREDPVTPKRVFDTARLLVTGNRRGWFKAKCPKLDDYLAPDAPEGYSRRINCLSLHIGQ